MNQWRLTTKVIEKVIITLHCKYCDLEIKKVARVVMHEGTIHYQENSH